MLTEPKPLATPNPIEVPLSEAPLVRVIAQVRFPPILSIRKEDKVADFQDSLRSDYPHLQRDEVNDVDFRTGQDPVLSRAIIWRLANQSEPSTWRVSLGIDFVAVETSNYSSRGNFLNRLRAVLVSVEKYFQPAAAQRIGLRYIDRLQGKAIDRIGELIDGPVLGILQPSEGPSAALRHATAQSMTQVQFFATEGVIQGRWGNLPANASYDFDALQPVSEPSWVLDLDMYSPNPMPFESENLVNKAEIFAEHIYSVFRLMVTNEFLKFYGGSP